MTNGNEPMYPTTGKEFINNSDHDITVGLYGGLTKRELATFMAMQGLCAKGVPPNWQDLEVKKSWVEWVGEMSCEIADQTINELNKPIT